MKALTVVRPAMRRNIWCEGCGLGNLQGRLTQAVVKTVAGRLGADVNTREGLERVLNSVAMVSGIGCTSRMPGHLDFSTLHTTHGRALAYAAGLKMARPDLTVVLAAGDGDVFAIGGNHFIHAARRNVDLTLVCFDNRSYGMTGAQHSPTSLAGERGPSAPYGVFERTFDTIALAQGAGATFVAQAAVTTSQEHAAQLEELIAAAVAHRGFSFVSVVGTCHTGWGAQNNRSTAFRYRRFIESRVVSVERWRVMSPADRAKHFPLGFIHQEDIPDLQSSRPYLAAIEAAKAAGASAQELVEEIHLAAEEDPLVEHPRTALRFAGSGGQGVISAGEIILEAALRAGMGGVFTKNYGPEARGGEAFSDVILSGGEVHSPQADSLDLLVALNPETFGKFRGAVSPDGKIIANTTAIKDTSADPRVVPSPIGELLAREVRPPRRELGINVLALAIAMGYTGLVPRDAVEAAVMKSVGKKSPEMNRRAIEVGYREADRLRGAA